VRISAEALPAPIPASPNGLNLRRDISSAFGTFSPHEEKDLKGTLSDPLLSREESALDTNVPSALLLCEEKVPKADKELFSPCS
jgi:hypothetical protein